VTLEEAGTYIIKLHKTEHDAPEWQDAMRALMLVARGGSTILARIGVMRALHRNDVREFSDRKETHWAKRKLKRINKGGRRDGPPNEKSRPGLTPRGFLGVSRFLAAYEMAGFLRSLPKIHWTRPYRGESGSFWSMQ
jgi:hypothetical protein